MVWLVRLDSAIVYLSEESVPGDVQDENVGVDVRARVGGCTWNICGCSSSLAMRGGGVATSTRNDGGNVRKMTANCDRFEPVEKIPFLAPIRRTKITLQTQVDDQLANQRVFVGASICANDDIHVKRKLRLYASVKVHASHISSDIIVEEETD